MKKFKSIVLCCVCFFSFTSPLFANEDMCIELIRGAVYETQSNEWGSDSYKEFHRNYCHAFEEYKKDNIRGSAKASYAGFGGSGSFSREELEKRGEVTCESTNSLAKLKEYSDVVSQTISPIYRGVIQSCITAANTGLRGTTDFLDDDTVQFNLFYVPPPGVEQTSIPVTGDPQVPQGVVVCKGPLAEVRSGSRIGSTALQMNCWRNPKGAKPHPGGVVTVYTGAGPINGLLPSISSPSPEPRPASEWGYVIDNNLIKDARAMAKARRNPNEILNQDRIRPLHLAAAKCTAEIAELLLQIGADPNLKNKFNNTPATIACCARTEPCGPNSKVYEVLRRYGAKHDDGS